MRRVERTSSYFSPVTNEIVMDADYFDRFGVIAPKKLYKTLYQRLNCIVEIECGSRPHIRNGIKKEDIDARIIDRS
jgi:hypothetical protein